MSTSLRQATPADAPAIARLHLASWRAHYRGILPDAALDDVDPVAWEARRHGHLSQVGPGIVNWVLEDAGQVVGWCAVGPPRDPDLRAEAAATSELYALYLAPEAVGRGFGRALCAHAVAHAAAQGAAAMVLWVLRDNALARRFYRAAGFAADPRVGPTDCHGAPSVRLVRPLTQASLAAAGEAG